MPWTIKQSVVWSVAGGVEVIIDNIAIKATVTKYNSGGFAVERKAYFDQVPRGLNRYLNVRYLHLEKSESWQGWDAKTWAALLILDVTQVIGM
jgi:hypothetical protein